MNIIRKLLVKARLAKAKPHEKAELGQAPWGRQEVKAEPKASISARIIRKDGTIKDLGIIAKPKED